MEPHITTVLSVTSVEHAPALFLRIERRRWVEGAFTKRTQDLCSTSFIAIWILVISLVSEKNSLQLSKNITLNLTMKQRSYQSHWMFDRIQVHAAMSF